MSPSRFLTLAAIVVAVGVLTAACTLIDSSDSSTSTIDADTSGTIVITTETEPEGQAGSFQFTGVPTGTLSTGSTLVVSDLEPGTYTTTQVNPAPDFDVSGVACDDAASASPSSGDAGSRTAVVNLEAGETVTCRFTNTQRGSAVIASQTVPEAVGGQFQFTGSPTGTIPANGTLVVANLSPGTYTSTQRNPAPEFDVVGVECDDGGSATPSSGDAGSRTAVFNIDPGEMVTCTFTNARRGTLVVAMDSERSEASFLFTGVPSGTVSSNGTLVAANLTPGTYTTTLSDQDGLNLAEVVCDDEASPTSSSGDPSTRTAVYNLDPGEAVTCVFTDDDGFDLDEWLATWGGAGSGGSGGGSGGTSGGDDGVNPFVDPDEVFDQFPLPDELPSDAGTYAAPRPGPWNVTHYAGVLDCGVTSLTIPASPPESGTIEVLDGGATVIGTGIEGSVSLTMTASQEITGRYTGQFSGVEQGVPVVIDYFWQVVTDEHIVGFLTSTFSQEGVTCTIYRSFEMFYAG